MKKGRPSSFAEATAPPRLRRVLADALEYARRQDFAGYNKHDGLNSPLLAGLCGWGRWPRLLAIQLVMRAPFNPRPWLGVRRTRNPKGIGLFANACLDLYATHGEARVLEQAQELLDWLLAHPSRGFRGLSWGYPYPWQDVGFFAPRHFPNRVVTCWIGFAFLEAARQTGAPRYLEALPEIATFLTTEPRVLCDEPTMKCYTYVPDPAVDWAVMDVPALVGAYLAEAGEILGCQEYQEEARRLLNWVADKQTDYGAWYYTHPPGDSHITHDNYHTAIILDCFDRYRESSGDDSFQAIYHRGLRYYRDHLFTATGAPRFMNDREYPYDIHGAASGILCFARAARKQSEYWQAASRVLRFTLEKMYDPKGFFYYQKTRWWTRRFCLLRWANGWMTRALSFTLRTLGEIDDGENDDHAPTV